MEPLSYQRLLDLRLAKVLGWKQLSVSRGGEKAIILGIPPGAVRLEAVPEYSSDPSAYFDLAIAHDVLVTRPFDKWVVVDRAYLKLDPHLDYFPEKEMVATPGPAICRTILQKLGVVPPQG